MKYTFSVWVLSLLSPFPVIAVLRGDEQYGNIGGGKFWAFHSEGVSIVNPETCAVERTFSTDGRSRRLARTWNHGVYMERRTAEYEESGEGFIIINSGEVRFDGDSSPDGGTGEVLVFSTSPEAYDQPVRSRIDIGGRLVHSYAVHTRDQFWTYSDEGFLYVIDLDDLTRHTGNPIDIKQDLPHHGKLLWNEDGHLTNYSFATSNVDQAFFIIDMDSMTRIRTADFSEYVVPGTCLGTDTISYSNRNRHLYLACVPETGGILEIDVSDPPNPVFVAQHFNINGALHETPDEAVVVVTNKNNNTVHIFEPGQTGETSTNTHNIQVSGHPSAPAFFPSDSGGRADYIACMPLTENTNRNNMDSDGNIVCDVYSCSQASTSADVANGMCLYDESGHYLLRASIDQRPDVVSRTAPFGEACERCENPDNYEDGRCTCTPNCGSCSDDDYDAGRSGVMCVDLNEVLDGSVNRANLIPGAGSVKQAKPNGYSPQCGFGRTYRSHARGGVYDASVANFPSNSIQIVNMDTQSFHCAVNILGEPSRVIYVPPQNGDESPVLTTEEDRLPAGAIVGIVIGVIAAILLLVAIIYRTVPDSYNPCIGDDYDEDSNKSENSTGSSEDASEVRKSDITNGSDSSDSSVDSDDSDDSDNSDESDKDVVRKKSVRFSDQNTTASSDDIEIRIANTNISNESTAGSEGSNDDVDVAVSGESDDGVDIKIDSSNTDDSNGSSIAINYSRSSNCSSVDGTESKDSKSTKSSFVSVGGSKSSKSSKSSRSSNSSKSSKSSDTSASDKINEINSSNSGSDDDESKLV